MRCLQHERIFKCRRDYILPSGLSRASSSEVETSLISFFFSFYLLVMPGRGNCLLSFEITAPLSLLLPHLVINFAESVRPLPSSVPLENRCSGDSLCSLHRSMKMPEDAADYELRGSRTGLYIPDFPFLFLQLF